jgi:hypothetical protein
MPVASAPPDGVLPKPEDISICKRLGGCFGELADWPIGRLADRRPAAVPATAAPLQKCAFGEISLTITQLRAIEILLRKSIPDLAAAEIKSEQMYRYVVELPPVLSRDEWQRKYGQNPRLDMGSGGDRAAGEPAIA